MPGQGIAPAPGGLRQAPDNPAAGTGTGFRRLSGGHWFAPPGDQGSGSI